MGAENRRAELSHKLEIDALLDELYLYRKVDPTVKLQV
jgi:hypothetical protein